jgi:uncharacterized protein DUF6544
MAVTNIDTPAHNEPAAAPAGGNPRHRSSMRTAMKRVVVVVLVLHGMLHLLGAAKALGWAEVSGPTAAVGPAMGAAWLATGALVVVAGVFLASGVRCFWAVGSVAVVASQTMILTSWRDAQAGSLANVILLAAVIYGYAARGPTSYTAEYRRGVAAELTTSSSETVVTEADLVSLPPAVACYVRRSGAVGKPRITNLRARIHGRIRATASAAWMPFTAEQVNTYGTQPSRLFLMDATWFGIPVDVLHAYRGSSASMRVKACSLVPMVNANGPDLDRAETVTLFNDLCLLAPGALVGARITWHTIDADHVVGTFTNGPHTVSAELVFDLDHELVDFVSDDRLRASKDGKRFSPQRWSTPVQGHRTIGGLQLFMDGEGRWHAPAPEDEFTYLKFHIDEIAYNLSSTLTNRPLRPEGVAGPADSLVDGPPARRGS